MKSLDKTRKDKSNGFNTERNSSLMNQYSPLKIKIDSILSKDYQIWRTEKQKFNAVNSQTAKNRQLLSNYIHGIYRQYQIQDPLQTKYTSFYQTLKYPQKILTTPNLPLSIQTHQNLIPHLISTKTSLKTPTKPAKKGLELVNPKQSHISVTKLQQKQQFSYLTPQKIPLSQRTKIKFPQRTESSLHTSFLLNGSKNQGLNQNQTETNKNILANDNYEYLYESPYKSRLSIASRLADQSNKKSRYTNDKSRITVFEDFKPSQLEINSRQYLAQPKTFSYLTDKNNVQITFGSEQSLEKSNPQREHDLKNYQNKLYARRILQNLNPLNKIGFNPQNGSIKQSFRYCVGCQEPILEANINFHQNQCSQFKNILNLTTIQEITKQMSTKIQKILQKINQKSQQVHENDPQNITSSSRVLISEVQDQQNINSNKALNPLNSQSFNLEYDKVMGIGKNWGLLTEEVNKLKWFLIVKENFKKLQIPKV